MYVMTIHHVHSPAQTAKDTEAIFAEVTENESIIDRPLRGIHPLLDYEASESQSMISI